MKDRFGNQLTLKKFQDATKHLYVCVFGYGRRRKYVDGDGQVWVKCSGCFWKFPQEVSF